MKSFEEVTAGELAHVEGGVLGPVIAVGILIGMTVGGAYVLGYVAGATNDECKKPK